MCFSATASFLASVVLFPIGIYTTRKALNNNSPFLPLSLVPMAFGIQQAFEGIEWIGLDTGNINKIHFGAIGFLWFSHWFWLFWPAFMVLLLETVWWRKRLALAIAIFGFLAGSSLYLPILIKPDWLLVELVNGSINYDIQLIYDRVFSRGFTQIVYILIILIPLLISSSRTLLIFAALLSIFLGLTHFAFNYAFVSVWCYFAALLSLYVAFAIYQLSPSELEQTDAKIS